MKQLAAKDQELHGKQREIDLLYGKLAADSPLTDAELHQTHARSAPARANTEDEATKRSKTNGREG